MQHRNRLITAACAAAMVATALAFNLFCGFGLALFFAGGFVTPRVVEDGLGAFLLLVVDVVVTGALLVASVDRDAFWAILLMTAFAGIGAQDLGGLARTLLVAATSRVRPSRGMR